MNIEVAALHDSVGEFIVWAGRGNCAYCMEMRDVEAARDVLRELETAASVLRARIDIANSVLGRTDPPNTAPETKHET